MPTSAPPLAYRPGLDTVRAVAILVVVIGHWVPLEFPLSVMGHMTFFVLSGYFISGIIWKQAVYVGGSSGWSRRLGIFYLRRVVRTLPPYYAALLLSALLPLATVHEYPNWFVLPLSNILVYNTQHWGEGVGHYWTLAVDEQFYLLWPVLLTLMPRRLRWLGLVAASALLFRMVWALVSTNTFAFVLLPGCLDMLALGGMLRLAEHHPRLRRLARLRWVLVGWLGWASLWAVLHYTGAHSAWLLLYPSAGSLPAALTLNWALHQPTRPPSESRLQRMMLWLGQRSYGFYLYHLLLPVFYQRAVFRLFPLTFEHGAEMRALLLSPLPTVLLLTPALLAMTSVSWTLLEAPLNRWKDRLAYSPSP